MIGTQDQKREIELALKNFSSRPLSEAALHLFDVLGYRSGRRLSLKDNTPATFLATFAQGKQFNEAACYGEWKSADFLFQLTDEEVRNAANGQLDFGSEGVFNGAIINSYLFFAIGLKGIRYSRSALAGITRQVNRLFNMPAMILFRHGDTLTLAIINRRLSKRESAKDVLEKVTLIRDIRMEQPHRAHIEILFDLSLDALYERNRFSNFVELHSSWQRTLDTSTLNRVFYQELANWYFWATATVRLPKGTGETDDVRNATAVIRLITRLIFVWFIKERDLVPSAIFDSSRLKSILKVDPADTPEGSEFYKGILQNLFFATLNVEMGEKRRFRGRNDAGGQDSHFCINNVYRYEKLFQSPDDALELFKNIPFLNGGLFECLDTPVKVNGRTTCVRVDGFSDRADNALYVPNKLFFSDEFLTPGLNEVFGTKGKIYKTRGLLRILNSYKFTVDENTPIEEEVALDPELLGKVFENLLASYNPETSTTARKQTGSFYTPRQIVDYMVDESLAVYLAKELTDSTEASPSHALKKVRKLLSYSQAPHEFSVDEVAALISAIDNIKILDPACGSGAFPMGMLQKLVHVLGKLDPGNREWKNRQILRIAKLRREAEEIEDGALRDHVLSDLSLQRQDIEKAFERNELNYGRKLYLIENCIFGVDIQPIAVQISKLRFFISLIVDETIDSSLRNRGVLPLPNLETKFVAANTLIDMPRQGTLRTHADEIRGIERELRQVRKEHFHARTQVKKEKCRAKDRALREKLSSLLLHDNFSPQVANELAGWDPYDHNRTARFFDPQWMFELDEGFDIVIGNPPYMRVQGLQLTQPDFVPIYRQRFQSAKGSFDIYALFVERGYGLLNDDGQLSYILPHKFFQASFGSGLRSLLTARKALREVVRFGSQQVFDEATTYTCLLFLTAKPQSRFDLLEVSSLKDGEQALLAARERQEHPDYACGTLDAPTGDDWDFTLGDSNKVMQRLRQHPITLGQITRKIFVGLQTSADKIYVLKVLEAGDVMRCFSRQLDTEIEIEIGLTRPFLLGKDVHRYEAARPEHVVIFPYWIRNKQAELMSQAEIKERFPLGWKYLMANRGPLGDREKGKMRGSDFYAYIYPKNLCEFDAVKIMTPDICARPEMTLDQEGNLYHTTTLYSFVFTPEARGNPYYFLGLLNSKVVWYFITVTGTPLRGDFYRFKTEYLRPFPIPEIRSEHQQLIETFVRYVLALKRQSAGSDSSPALAVMSAWFERLIDALVYELYFPEEFVLSESRVSSALSTVDFVPPTKLGNNPFNVLTKLFGILHDPQHPVRRAAFFLDSVSFVRIIEGKP